MVDSTLTIAELDDLMQSEKGKICDKKIASKEFGKVRAQMEQVQNLTLWSICG